MPVLPTLAAGHYGMRDAMVVKDGGLVGLKQAPMRTASSVCTRQADWKVAQLEEK
jgi:hypothetical protein